MPSKKFSSPGPITVDKKSPPKPPDVESVEDDIRHPEEEGPAPSPSPPPPPPSPPLAELFSGDSEQFKNDQIEAIVNRQILFDLEKTELLKNYNVLFLFEEKSITRFYANQIYNAVTGADKNKPILLVLNSPGGDIAAAYFIAKLCREYTNENFEVAVPRQAKSAATLICCGADRIHMGSLSELGPIDPQFGGVPALALKHSVEHLAQLAKDYPEAAEMFSSYLSKCIRVEALGYYERVAKSATHYAIRLLDSRRAVATDALNSAKIANRLVYEYMDHGFVIDFREAIDIFGDSVVVNNTIEYKGANSLYQTLDFLSWVCQNRFGRLFSYVGNAENGCCLIAMRSS
jgi:hypothetical protein